MANTDSFIDEVTEEVRRDRLFGLFRKWAWLAITIVVVLVGGAAYIEYSRAQERATAEAFGSAVLSALDQETPEERVAALEAVTSPGAQGEVLLALLAAGETASGDDLDATAERLRSAAASSDLPRIYRDLALLKAHLIAPGPDAEARQILQAIAEPGAPYAALGEEQLAIMDIRTGDFDAGIERLRGLENTAAATPGLQQRAAQLIIALEAGATLIDTRPIEEETPETPVEDAPVEEVAPAEADTTADAPEVTTEAATEAATEDAAPLTEETEATDETEETNETTTTP